jgi:uncharacterized membrane protein YphA (DoxX/SURF4 family)
MTNSKYQIGIVTIVALVALRLGIGLHFYNEGVGKVRDPKPFSAGFLGSAKGPLAGVFHSMVWDTDGQVRLDIEGTLQAWDIYRERVSNHYGFDDKQKQKAADVQKQREGQLKGFFSENNDDIDKYFKELARLDAQKKNPAIRNVPSLRTQSEKLDGDLRKQRGPWLAQIDDLWKAYERDLNSLASADQSRRVLRLPKPQQKMLSAEFVDGVIPIFDITIGVLLMLGLFTRATSVVAALFLCSVMASQWPGAYGALPIYNQGVETLALLVLAATGAGRFAGLDSLLGYLRPWCCPPKTGEQK